jgi:hypothetical protein
MGVGLILAACVPTIQQAAKPPLAFEGPRFDGAGKAFHSFDGARLGFSSWRPETQ